MEKKLFSVAAAYESMNQVAEEVKYPHMMYDPKTGKEVEAKTPADHAKFAKMGYTHEKPKMDEVSKESVNVEEKKMDPVGKADADIDNDGDVDKSDEYLHNRRKAIKKAMKKDEKVKKEDTDIRSKLMSIWEDAAGVKRKKDQNRENMPKDDARSDKKMMDGSPSEKHGKGEKEDPESKKAEDSTKAAPMRNNDNKQGDKAIMKSATPDHPAHKTTKEQVEEIKAAYESMYKKEDENGS